MSRSLMALPEGKACRDCKLVRRCVAMFGVDSGNTECDFYPIRFVDSGLARTAPDPMPPADEGTP